MPGFAWREEKSPSMPRARKYSQELLDRGARLVFESERPIAHVARDLGVGAEALRLWDAVWEVATFPGLAELKQMVANGVPSNASARAGVMLTVGVVALDAPHAAPGAATFGVALALT